MSNFRIHLRRYLISLEIDVYFAALYNQIETFGIKLKGLIFPRLQELRYKQKAPKFNAEIN